MRKKPIPFLKNNLINFLRAWINIVIFLPNFFSVKNLLMTLFFPWKNIVFTQKVKGFNLGEWLEISFSNLISRLIGFYMRISLITFYLLLNLLIILLFPILFFLFILFQPIFYLLSLFQKDENELRELSKKEFLNSHLLDPKNIDKVLLWFEDYYSTTIKKQPWWELKNLLSLPPLARHWSAGYTYYLDQYGQELTSESYLANRPVIVDRENEIKQIESILSRSMEPNVILIGDEGVGKHTVIDSLANRIYYGQSHPQLAYRRIFKLNMQKVLSQFTDKSKREEFFDELLDEAVRAKNLIIFIDNLERYVNFYHPQGIDLSNVIEKYAKRNDIQFIGITHLFAYQKFILPNEKITRLFTPIKIDEIDSDTALKILLNLTFSFEFRYQVTIPYETLLTLINQSQFFITYIPFPEKAIVLLDEICAYAQSNRIKVIKPELVNLILSKKIQVPTALTEEIRNKLINLESLLKQRIIHQDYAISSLTNSLKNAFILLGKRKEPLARFLFLGPTGVGKTETAKALAQIFFGSEKFLIRFDMSLYQSKNDIPKLIGDMTTANPGLLSKAIREQPYGVLLLDEIEKADPDLINIFLTILDEGYFTDGFGKKVNCHNLVIIATSNAGAEFIFTKINNQVSINEKKLEKEMINYLIKNKIFMPEFLNRFDGVIFYQPLTQTTVKEIVKKIIKENITQIENSFQIKIIITDNFVNKLLDKSHNLSFGAREIRRMIETEIEYKIADLILNKKIKPNETITF